jgi:hypothetical protein
MLVFGWMHGSPRLLHLTKTNPSYYLRELHYQRYRAIIG